jgi:predicted Rossmann fold flavoprotein
MFPVTDDSATVVDCLLRSARSTGVEVRVGAAVRSLSHDGKAFALGLTTETLAADRVILATGGGSGGGGHALAASMGHSLEPSVPSLFSFNIRHRLLEGLSGLSVERVATQVDGLRLREEGPVLVTHGGLSGPGILRLSAWGARELATRGHRFTLRLNFLPGSDPALVATTLASLRLGEPRKQVTTWNPFGLPARLWERLVEVAGLPAGVTWANLSAGQAQSLLGWLTAAELPVSGKSPNKEEFVTCGGVRLREVDFRTMESRVRPGLHLAGEVLDIDGVTGGFNFQAAWTTGWLAGKATAA